MCIANNLFILFSYAFHCVKNHQNYVATIHCAQGTHNAVFFNRFVNLRFTTHTSSINEQITLTITYNRSVNCITSCASYITYDGTLFAYQRIKDRRFANVRTTNQRNLNFIFVFRLAKGIFIAKLSNNSVQQIAQTQMVCCRYRDGLANTKIIELVNVHLLFRRIRLIDCKDDRFFRFTQNSSNICVLSTDAGTCIANEKNNICFTNSNLRLLTNGHSNCVRIHNFDTTGINHHKFVVKPFSSCIKSIAGNTGGVFNDRDSAISKNIK